MNIHYCIYRSGASMQRSVSQMHQFLLIFKTQDHKNTGYHYSFSDWHLISKLFFKKLCLLTVCFCTCEILAIYNRSKKEKKKRNTSIYSNANYKQRNEICTNQHGLLSTSILCLKNFLRVVYMGGFYLTLIFSM